MVAAPKLYDSVIEKSPLQEMFQKGIDGVTRQMNLINQLLTSEAPDIEAIEAKIKKLRRDLDEIGEFADNMDIYESLEEGSEQYDEVPFLPREDSVAENIHVPIRYRKRKVSDKVIPSKHYKVPVELYDTFDAIENAFKELPQKGNATKSQEQEKGVDYLQSIINPYLQNSKFNKNPERIESLLLLASNASWVGLLNILKDSYFNPRSIFDQIIIVEVCLWNLTEVKSNSIELGYDWSNLVNKLIMRKKKLLKKLAASKNVEFEP